MLHYYLSLHMHLAGSQDARRPVPHRLGQRSCCFNMAAVRWGCRRDELRHLVHAPVHGKGRRQRLGAGLLAELHAPPRNCSRSSSNCRCVRAADTAPSASSTSLGHQEARRCRGGSRPADAQATEAQEQGEVELMGVLVGEVWGEVWGEVRCGEEQGEDPHMGIMAGEKEEQMRCCGRLR